MTILRWTPPRLGPLAELGRIGRELDRIAKSAFSHVTPRGAGVYPPVNLTEDDDNLYVRAELPGVAADDLDISVQADTLTIRGERKPTDLGKEISVHRREREFGFFRRVISLPTAIDTGSVEATAVDGVLTITLPKAPEVKPRQISVSTKQKGGEQ